MSTAAGDAPAPRTPTPSVKERTVALESELLRHTEATTSGGEIVPGLGKLGNPKPSPNRNRNPNPNPGPNPSPNPSPDPR